MADTKYAVELELQTRADAAALKGVRDNLAEINGHAEKATSGIGGMGRALTSFLAIGASLGTFAAFLKDAFYAFVEGQKALDEFEQTARLVAGATDTDVAAMHDWISAFEKASGIAKEKLLPSFTQLVTATGDLSSAQRLAEVAAGAAARGIGTLEQNVGTLTRVIETGKVRGVGPFTNLLRDAKDKTGDWGSAVGLLYDKLGDAGAAVETISMELDRNKTAWSNTKESIGETLANLGEATGVFKYGAYAIAGVAGALVTLVGWFKAAGEAVFGFSRSLGILASGNLEGAKKAALETSVAVYNTVQEYQQKTDKLFDGVIAAYERVEAKIGTKGPDKSVRDAVNEAFERAEQERKAREAAAAARREAEAIRRARAEYESTGPIGLRDDLNSQRKSAEIRRRKLAEETRLAEQIRDAHNRAGQEALDVRARQFEKSKDMAAEAAQAEIRGREAVASASIAAAQAVFGESKALSIAQAIISAYAAAAGAARDTHGDVFTRIAAYIAAFTTVWRAVTAIESTELTSGASGASGGGATGSRAYTPTVYRQTTPIGGGGGVVNNTTTTSIANQNAPSQVIQVNALTGTQAAAAYREFETGRRVTSRAVSRTIVNRQRTTISPNGR